VFGVNLGEDYESIARLCLYNKKFGICNMFTSAVCWGLRKLRNSLCFQGVAWISLRVLWQSVVYDQVVENVGTAERDGWLPQCSSGPGEAGVCAGTLAMEIGAV
jgi:hypothetical protein